MPRVSVILNSFNQGRYLATAVESVLNQKFGDYELIAIDNGSTDDSRAILQRYASDPKVRLFLHDTNVPVTRRFNEGIEAARGELISFLYSDDYYLPAKLERQVAEFDRLDPEYGVVYSRGYGLNDLTGKMWLTPSFGASGWIFREMCLEHLRGSIDMIAPLIRRTCLQRYPFHEDIFAEGEAIYFRIALRHKFSFIDEPLVVIRDHDKNAGKALKRNAQMTFTSIAKLEQEADFRDECRPWLRHYRAAVYRSYGWQGVRLSDDMAWTRSCFRNAIKTDWKMALHPKTVAGVVLSCLPARLRTRINALGTRMRGKPSNDIYVQDYGGSISNY